MADRLDETRIGMLLRTLPGWRRSADGTAIERDWRFADFAGAFAFVTQVAGIAEAADHHPEIAFGWGRARVTLSTHDAGGLTEQDFALAEAIGADAPRGTP